MDPDAQVRLQGGYPARDPDPHRGVEPERWLAPLRSEPWGYRRKARLRVRWVATRVHWQSSDWSAVSRASGARSASGGRLFQVPEQSNARN